MVATKAPVPGIAPESELLLCCARTHVEAREMERLRELLQTNIDWQYVVQQASRHAVLPLLYWNLQRFCQDAVPEPILEHLHHAFHAQARHSLLLNSTLLSLLSLFEAHGIPALPYKGPVLAAVAYGNLLWRQFSDLDLLVPPHELRRAQELLLARGYRQIPPLHAQPGRLSETFQKLYERLRDTCRKVCELVSADGQVIVELHSQITSWTFFFPLEPAYLWKCCETTILTGVPVRNLPPEETLLILCVHGAKHRWWRLGWICDIAELLRAHPHLNWHRVMEEGDRRGGRRMLLLGLLLAHGLLGALVPPDIARRMAADRHVVWLAAKVREQLFMPTEHDCAAVERPFFFLRLRERLRDKVRSSGYLAYYYTIRYGLLGS